MAKNPNPTDRHVGSRIRMKRMQLGLTQERIADGLGLTFQQVQKYEKGTNRVGASRLQQLARILGVTESYFFEGAPAPNSASVANIGAGTGMNVTASEFDDFLASRDGLKLIVGFMNIKDQRFRRAIIHMVQDAAGMRATPHDSE